MEGLGGGVRRKRSVTVASGAFEEEGGHVLQKGSGVRALCRGLRYERKCNKINVDNFVLEPSTFAFLKITSANKFSSHRSLHATHKVEQNPFIKRQFASRD